MKIGKREFDVQHHCYIMGILNVTPDSFSDGGKYDRMDKALSHVEEMLKEGADIIDIGGESTRPGYKKITDEEEMDRVLPVIEAVRREFDPVISIDTYKSPVARAAIKAGADLVNDVWGLQWDGTMAKVIADNHVACCLMHNRRNMDYSDKRGRWNFNRAYFRDISNIIATAEEAGIEKDKIILDPGVGFGKNTEMNLAVMKELGCIKACGYPYMLAASRKSVIGAVLDKPVDQRLFGTVATTVYAVMQGASFVRVHDIRENREAIIMTEAIRDASIDVERPE